MKARFSPATFSVAFCCAYVGVFAMDVPLFRYYPLHGDWSWGQAMVKGMGPAMAWYGLMASAALVALAVALVLPGAWLDRALRNRYWIFPCAAMLGCLFLLRKFFA